MIARLDAHLRLLGDAQRAATTSPDGLVAEALLVREERPAEAARCVDRALALDARHVPARVLRDRLEAAARPGVLLDRLTLPLDDEQRALALVAMRSVWAAALARAPRDAGSAADPELERALGALARLRVDAGPLADGKARALAASAGEWDRAFEAAIRAGAETAPLERLVRLCAATPAVAPGPALTAVLERAHDRVRKAATDALVREGPRAALVRGVRFEERSLYLLGVRRGASAERLGAMQSLLAFVEVGELSPEDGLSIALACLRAGVRTTLREASSLAPRSSWEAFRLRVPGSRAARAALACVAPAEDLHAVVAELEAAPLDDLAPVFVGGLLLRAAQLDLRVAPADPRSLEAARRAAVLLREAPTFVLFEALRTEGHLVRALHGPAAAIESWTAAAAVLQAAATEQVAAIEAWVAAVAELEAVLGHRTGGGTDDRVLDVAREPEGFQFPSACRVELARDRIALGQTDAAERELEEVVEHAKRSGFARKKTALAGRTLLCELRREAGRLEAAAEALGDVNDFLKEPDLMVEVVRLLLARGERERARALVERCAASEPDRRIDVRELRAVLDE